jgi:hypothetical protein
VCKKKQKFLECFSNRRGFEDQRRGRKEEKERERDLNDQLVHSVGLAVAVAVENGVVEIGIGVLLQESQSNGSIQVNS